MAGVVLVDAVLRVDEELLHAPNLQLAIHVLVHAGALTLQHDFVTIDVRELQQNLRVAGRLRHMHLRNLHHLLVSVEANGVEVQLRIISAVQGPHDCRGGSGECTLLAGGVVLGLHGVGAGGRRLQHVDLGTVALREVSGDVTTDRRPLVAVEDLVSRRLDHVKVDVGVVRVPTQPDDQAEGEVGGPEFVLQRPEILQALLRADVHQHVQQHQRGPLDFHESIGPMVVHDRGRELNGFPKCHLLEAAPQAAEGPRQGAVQEALRLGWREGPDSVEDGEGELHSVGLQEEVAKASHHLHILHIHLQAI
mmetsp:Transcript_5342/g.14879  ORF Transcript_5342/g.14879 Transcript_5342/m.14879 type:complete len:307 (-) Transcript_5342:220-1140(-)